MTFMANVIDRASVSAEEALRFDSDEMAELERLFGDEERLMLALRQRWMTTLTAKLDQAAHEGVPAAQVRARLAAAQPGLRALLDAAARGSVRLRALDRGEQRTLDYFDGPNPLLRDDRDDAA